MRVSKIMLSTQRNVPAEAEIISHQLLLRGGFIKRVTSGIYAYLPLMWKVLQKITNIVQEEMNEIGGLQTLLPQIHPSELWKESGRWEGYTNGEGIMFNLKDRQGREVALAPTHEEVVTKIAKETLHSYKQLPIILYQIQTKFRDEIRPRFGLMRSREFIMKDAYSFHKSEQDLNLTYKRMDQAYKNIFLRCGLKTVAVEADSGAIGGSSSQEFMVTADSGEDLILISSDGSYAANQEKAISEATTPVKIASKSNKPKEIKTPGQSSIKDLCKEQNIDASQIIKVIIKLAIIEGGKKQPILISIRGDQELNEIKLINEITIHLKKSLLDLLPVTNELLAKEGLGDLPFGSIGPDLNNNYLKDASSWEKYFLRFTDCTASNLDNFVCGANKVDTHRISFKWDLLGGKAKVVDIRKANAGDRCIHDNRQILSECRGIEVGHIFQLGRKYSKSLNANFTNEKGGQEPFWMGCYGIGISRLAQAAVEQNNDANGIIWPLTISPFEIIITVANMQDEVQTKLGEDLYKKLIHEKIDVLYDDRNERAGIKFKDADLIGIPWRLTVGRDSSIGKVELFNRSTNTAEILSAETALLKILGEIKSKKR